MGSIVASLNYKFILWIIQYIPFNFFCLVRGKLHYSIQFFSRCFILIFLKVSLVSELYKLINYIEREFSPNTLLLVLCLRLPISCYCCDILNFVMMETISLH